MLEQSLSHLGLKDKEIQVFSALMELGPQHASTLAKRIGVPRGTAYLLLDTLVSHGLVSRIVRAGVQTFAPISPDEILEIIRKRRRELDLQESHLKLMLPQLHKMMGRYAARPKVRFYEGEEGVKMVMDETLTSKEPLLSYLNMDAWMNTPLSDYIQTYCRRRSYEKKIFLKCLVHDTPGAREHFSTGHDLFEVHYIPKEVQFESSLINIFENKVLMVSLEAGNLCGVIIESEQIASTQKAIFELAWRGCHPECHRIHS